MNEKNIPSGQYCYDVNGICPYWSIDDNLPYQYNGYCSYLDKNDIEINGESVLIDVKTGKVENPLELGLPFSLLWDQCKECRINI